MKYYIEMSPERLVQLNDLLQISAEAFKAIVGGAPEGTFDAEKRILRARNILDLGNMQTKEPVGPAIIPET